MEDTSIVSDLSGVETMKRKMTRFLQKIETSGIHFLKINIII